MKAYKEFKVGKHGITYVSYRFEDYFGKVDVTPTPTTLSSVLLKRAMDDFEIQKELNIGELTLDVVLAVLLEKKTLLTNGYANIFYVKDVTGVLRAVVVHWFGDGWSVDAFPLGGYGWYAGHQVFSRNSSTPKTPADTLNLGALDPSSIRITLEVAGVKYEAQFKKAA